MKNPHIHLTIIIPAFHEEKRIGSTLDKLSNYLMKDNFLKNINIEVLVVIADSLDSTYSIAQSKRSLFRNFKILRPGPKVGKGRDVKFGMDHAKGDFALFMDADLATPLWHIEEFYKAALKGSDLIIGTRNLRKYKENVLKNMLAFGSAKAYKALIKSNIDDTQCGFKMFDREARHVCFSKLTVLGWGFDLEVLEIARVNDLKILTIRIDDWANMPFSTHTDSTFEIAIRMIKDLRSIYVNKLKKVYGSRD